MKLSRIHELVDELEAEIDKGKKNTVDEPLTRLIDLTPIRLWADLVQSNRKKIAECFE